LSSCITVPQLKCTGSLAFHAALLCRISIMLCYNVNLLLLAPEDTRFATPNTVFYCLFGARSRMVVHGHDYYLLISPLLLLLLFCFFHLNLDARCCNFLAACFKSPKLNKWAPGVALVFPEEDEGRIRVAKVLHERQEARQLQRTLRDAITANAEAESGEAAARSQTPQSSGCRTEML